MACAATAPARSPARVVQPAARCADPIAALSARQNVATTRVALERATAKSSAAQPVSRSARSMAVATASVWVAGSSAAPMPMSAPIPAAAATSAAARPKAAPPIAYPRKTAASMPIAREPAASMASACRSRPRIPQPTRRQTPRRTRRPIHQRIRRPIHRRIPQQPLRRPACQEHARTSRVSAGRPRTMAAAARSIAARAALAARFA